MCLLGDKDSMTVVTARLKMRIFDIQTSRNRILRMWDYGDRPDLKYLRKQGKKNIHDDRKATRCRWYHVARSKHLPVTDRWILEQSPM